jgi:uncharacterized protein with von Willebrand factor type A (vWA) domain
LTSQNRDPAGPTDHQDPAATTGADRMAVTFSRLLRAQGLVVPVGAVTTYAAALGALGLDRRESVYWAGRATLLRRPEDLVVYDRSFAAFWLGRPFTAPDTTHQPPAPTAATAMGSLDAGDRAPTTTDMAVPLRYSAVEVLRDKDFAAYTPAEFAEARQLIAGVRLRGEVRRSRRRRRSSSLAPTSRSQPDVRATLRRAHATGGEAVRRAWREPVSRPRRVVLLCDVSGSMEPYARALLRFAHAAVVGRGAGRVEAFAVGTRLTRLTRELAWRDPDEALTRAAKAVTDWSGGTRLGAGLHAFNEDYGVRGMARGAVVVVVSDGWDRGDPAVLGAEMARLHLVAHRVIWVNPLQAAPGYAPLAGGMAAALPHVDAFVAGNSLAALEDLVAVIAGKRGAGLA